MTLEAMLVPTHHTNHFHRTHLKRNNVKKTGFLHRSFMNISSMKNALVKLSWRSKARLLFKVLLAVGFIAQSMIFLEMYLQYPCMLQLNVEQPDEVEFPAFTVCNVNEVRAKPFCSAYPTRCGTPATEPDFCSKFSEYCRLVNDSEKMVPKVFVDEYNLTRYEQQLFGHQWEDLVVSCVVDIDGNETGCEGSPILVPALSHSNSVPYNCFMMYSLYGQPDSRPKMVPTSTVIRIHMNVETADYHPYHLSRGAQISIHSAYHLPSPTREGKLLNLGKIYRFYLQLSRQYLLPAPYQSNCTDYMSRWRENGGRGPVTNNMCVQKCKLDKSLKEHGCAHHTIDYPHNETMCEKDMPEFQRTSRYECSGQCTMPCNLSRYQFQVQEANSEGNRKSCMYSTDLSCAILVQIFMENMEITTFTYRPTFEAVGILSWIGGYVGLWLGISLLHVYDFLERWVFRLIAALRKRLRRKDALKRTTHKKAYFNDDKHYQNRMLWNR